MAGVLAIALIAGASTWAFLMIAGVGYRSRSRWWSRCAK
jgi:hypothetical protein